ncbi:hypothetical protein OQ496_02535 [Acetobacter suratthaniensis]|uniref:Uncharacterized protein n=1 Tax=Acetobacter suratthaniensis TaxID=1502841 RepID=A0ABS3LK76_9PROT|nr:hypothetical protein [Acetobacter suratthaniensis]MBO1327058.1 hypothetical protein [Acetobacter suratthaniensis]MCX2565332.1 hypothetical protein [Acetobacter suratthaniensis]
MSLSRLLAAGIFAAGVAHGSVSFAASPCGHSPAHEAFDVQGLKSELMVTALKCSAQDRYNDFVAKFRPELLAAESKLNGYFRSVYGRKGQQEFDNYITQLGLVQEDAGLQSGTLFCQQRVSMFDEVKALESAEDLANYAEGKDVSQPSTFEACAAPSTAHPTAPTRRRTTRKA